MFFLCLRYMFGRRCFFCLSKYRGIGGREGRKSHSILPSQRIGPRPSLGHDHYLSALGAIPPRPPFLSSSILSPCSLAITPSAPRSGSIETRTIQTKTIETRTIETRTIETRTIETRTIETRTTERGMGLFSLHIPPHPAPIVLAASAFCLT